MELIYLWVEEYKNIYKQGLNLSHRFSCEFEHENNKLTIAKHKEYVSVFPDNINVTAIVGENGSGKSSIVKFVFKMIYFNKYKNLEMASYYMDQGFLILHERGKFYKMSMLADSSSKSEQTVRVGVVGYFDGQQIKITDLEEKDIDFYSIHFNYMIDTLKDSDEDKFVDTIYHKSDNYDCPLLLEPYKMVGSREQIDIANLEYLSQQKFANVFKLGIKNDFIKKFFQPNYVKTEVNINKILNKIDRLSENTVDNPLSAGMTESKKNNIFVKTSPGDVKRKITRILAEREYQKINKIYLALKILEKNYHERFKEFKNIFNAFFKSKNLEETIENTIRAVDKVQNEIIKILSEAKVPTFEIQKIINSIYFDEHILNHTNKENSFRINLTKKVSIDQIKDDLIYYAPWIDIEYFENDKSYKSLSSGEKTLYSFMINLMYQVNNLKDTSYKHVNLFLDETELGLHPQWQKEYLKYILLSLENFDINIHLIFITHSPFILSDLPKENIVFLERGKQVLPNIETFGANIHTLLSHGFFMKDGLMGEFAKEKIDKVIQILNQSGKISKRSLTYCENIISIIGEPILKWQLQKMIDSKRLNKIDEIDRIKADIAELHQKLKKLESRK